MASETTTTASARPRRQARKGNGRRNPHRGGEQARIMAYGMVVVGLKGQGLAHVYERKRPSVTRCGLEVGPRSDEVREGSFADYSEGECQVCCEIFGVARLWQIYPPMNLGSHLWDERGRRR